MSWNPVTWQMDIMTSYFLVRNQWFSQCQVPVSFEGLLTLSGPQGIGSDFRFREAGLYLGRGTHPYGP